MITIVDYDAGNAGSIVNIVRRAGGQAQISGDPSIIAASEKLILPGVGHFGRAIERLNSQGIGAALNEAVLVRKVPILGICLGMQLFCAHSEEGDATGLGWLDARAVRFQFNGDSSLKVPHMSWNHIDPVREDPLFASLPEEARFYFVHSYRVVCDVAEDALAYTTYGEPFVSAVGRGNIRGTQFHPEKSHRYGLAVIRNFVSAISEC